ncbi:Chaperonin-like RbcX protein 2, chloroplastic [Linum perenne]
MVVGGSAAAAAALPTCLCLARTSRATTMVELSSTSGTIRRISGHFRKQQQRRDRRRLVAVGSIGGEYEDSFGDVKLQIVNLFTFKAVRTVMNQLYEMNPTQYRWFYDFVATNKPGNGKLFLRTLAKERQDLAERVMVTRLHLYGKWIKKCDHEEMYKAISDENLELMRERLLETVIWPSDDTNTEKIG